MGMCTRALLLLTKSVAMASTFGRMKITTSANSLTESRKVLGSGKITLPMMSIKESITTTEETEKVSIDGVMVTFTMVSSKMISEKVSVKWFGLPDKFIKAHGKTVSKMVLAHCIYSMAITTYSSGSLSLWMEYKWKKAKTFNLYPTFPTPKDSQNFPPNPKDIPIFQVPV